MPTEKKKCTLVRIVCFAKRKAATASLDTGVEELVRRVKRANQMGLPEQFFLRINVFLNAVRYLP
jgi:hypothetical protein